MKYIKPLKSNQQGFTIIELMIATSILAVILVVVTVMMINVGNLYYKGANQSRVQNNVRSIADDVAERIQLGGEVVVKPVNADTGAFCIGTTKYSYVLYRKLAASDQAGAAPTKHGLWRSDNRDDCAPPANAAELDVPEPAFGTNGQELLGANMRLNEFSIGSASPYNIRISISYGDADLITGYNEGSNTYLGQPNTRCSGGAGSTYCAAATLETAVGQRLR